jgi:hypothetical protein
MIKIDRAKEPCPPTLLKKGVEETKSNIAIIANDINGKPDFNAYKRKPVLQALQRLFYSLR